MSQKQAAERYASTLLSLAKDKNLDSKVRTDMNVLRDAFETKELYDAIQSPIIEGAKKKSILKAVFDGKVESITLDFMGLMIDKGRDKAIKEAIHSFIRLYNDDKNIKQVKITTATQLETSDFESLKSQIKQTYFNDCELEIEHAIDAGLIGGFIMEFDDQLLDASIRSQLRKLSVKYSN